MKKEQFKNWLIDKGYSEYSKSGHPSTAYDYPRRIDVICEWESLSWELLAENISTILQKYDIGGIKETEGKKSNSAFINALKRYAEFTMKNDELFNNEFNPKQKHTESHKILKHVVLELLKSLSKNIIRVEYGELSKILLKIYNLNVNNHFGFTRNLDKLNDIFIRLNLPLISVMIVEKSSQRPSDGFYSYARNIIKNHPSYKYKYIGNDKEILKKAKKYILDCKNEEWDKLKSYLDGENIQLEENSIGSNQPNSIIRSPNIEKLKNSINDFVDSFFAYVAEKTGYNIVNQKNNILKKGSFLKGINLFAENSIGFYETWNEHACYLILYDKSEPVLELQLTRILFSNDDKITWYLRNPSSPNKKLYQKQGLILLDLPDETFQQIKEQQQNFDGNDYKYDNGRQVYEFVVDCPIEKVFEKLLLLCVKDAITTAENKPQPRPEKQNVPTSSKEYPTDQVLREMAVINSNHTCEYDGKHTSFKSKSTNNQYMEGHHLVPMGKQDDFNNKLDISVNIFSLCPNCHKRVHYAVFEEKRPILIKLFNKRQKELERMIPEINLEKLLNLYS